MKVLEKRWVPAAVALALVSSGSVAACGSDDEKASAGTGDQAAKVSPAERDIKAAYKSFVEAVYSGNGEAACGFLTRETQRRLAKQGGKNGTCVSQMEATGRDAGKLRPYIASIRIEGSRAVARAGTKKTGKYPLPWVKKNGKWLIAGGA